MAIISFDTVKKLGKKVISPVKEFLTPIGERGGAVIRSVQTKSLTPLKESFRRQAQRTFTQPGDSAETAIKKTLNLPFIGAQGTAKPAKVTVYGKTVGEVKPKTIKVNEYGKLSREIPTSGFKFTPKPQIKITPLRGAAGKFQGSVSDSVESLSQAKNSLKISPLGKKPGGLERATKEIEKGITPPVKLRRLEDGSTFIEDGRHHLEAARLKGLKSYPVEDVTAKYESQAGFGKLPDGLPPRLNEALNPIKETDEITQKAYSDWTRKKLVGKELANQESKKLSIPNEDGVKVLTDYTTGKPTVFSGAIKQSFDDLYDEAGKRGLNVPYRENYLPQVYKNSPEEVQTAVSRFLTDQGVDPQIVDDYIKGIKELPDEISKRLKLNPSFTKQRVLPDYETAMKYGLTPKYTNPAQLLGHYREELEKTVANKEFIDELVSKGKLKPVGEAPNDWKPVELSFSPKGLYAEPQLAKTLNGLYRNEADLTFGQSVAKTVGGVSKKMQDITLSGGVPKTNINFFSIGQTIKELTAGNFKALAPFVRANFNKASIKYLEENQDILKRMANQGIDLGGRIGQYGDAYKNLVAKNSWGEALGKGWDKLFNEKTFSSFLPQFHTQTFKDAYAKALKKGLSDAEAEVFAGDVTKNMFGLFEDVGRSKGTEDVISSIFFAPKFREGLIRTFWNTAKSVTTEIKNPAFYKNRRLVTGMILTAAAYDAMNKKLNGNHMWENEPGREFALKIPRENGEVFYLEFMPSFLAFARNMGSGAIAAAKLDPDTAKQKFGSLFSMPVKLANEVWANKDYFGDSIYQENDSGKEKATKIASHFGLNVSHPFIKEFLKQMGNSEQPGIKQAAKAIGVYNEEKKPLHQSILMGMELPLKFSSTAKINRGKYYEAAEQKTKENAARKDKVKPTYDKVQQLIKDGKTEEAQTYVDQLSEENYEAYKLIKQGDKSRQTNRGKAEMYDTYHKVQDLLREGKEDEAQTIVDNLSDEDYRLYKLVKNQFR